MAFCFLVETEFVFLSPPMERAQKNCLLMLRERGYAVTPMETSEDFKPVMTATHRRASRVAVYTVAGAKVGVRDTRRIVEDAVESGVDHIIVIHEHGITPFARGEIGKSDLRVELFPADFFGFHLTRHILVPPHRLVTPSERRLVADKYGIDRLPRLVSTDPVVRWLDLPRGAIVSIEEPSPEGHMVAEYRVVT